MTESKTSPVLIQWRPFSVKIDGVEQRLFARDETLDPPELHLVEQVEVSGEAVNRVQEVQLNHKRLGETRLAYGSLSLPGKSGLIVATDAAGVEQVTLRLAGAADITAPINSNEFTWAEEPQ